MTHTNYQYANTLNVLHRERFYENALKAFVISGYPLSHFSVWLTEIHEGRFYTAIKCLKGAQAEAQQQASFESIKHGGLYHSVCQAGLSKTYEEIEDAIKILEKQEEI